MGRTNTPTTDHPPGSGRVRRLRHRQRHHQRSRVAALALAGTLAVAACGGSDDDSGDGADEPAAEEAGFDMEMSQGDGDERLAVDDAGEAPADREGAVAGDTGGGFDIGVVGRDVIIEMRVVMSSDNIQRTVASIMANASTLGGGVSSSDVNYGTAAADQQDAYAVLVVKVPPSAVDRLLSGLDDSGVVQSINQSAQDVTEQLVNLDVRIENARQSVANVRQFMEATENLNELVSLEAELTRRQTELEQLEAQQRNLSDRVTLSTITVEVVPTAAIPEPVDAEPEADEGIADAFRSGWEAFATFMFAIAFVIASAAPFLVLFAVVALVAWLIVRRNDRRREPLAPPRHSVTATAAEVDEERETEDELVG